MTLAAGTLNYLHHWKINTATNPEINAFISTYSFSNFSETAVFYTSGKAPTAPLPPKLKEAGIYSLSLEWCAPTNPNPNDTLTYVLEMEEAKSVSLLFFLFPFFFYHKLNLIFQQHFTFYTYLSFEKKSALIESLCSELKQCRAIVGQVCIGLLIPKLAECKSSTLYPVSIHRSLLASSTTSLF